MCMEERHISKHEARDGFRGWVCSCNNTKVHYIPSMPVFSRVWVKLTPSHHKPRQWQPFVLVAIGSTLPRAYIKQHAISFGNHCWSIRVFLVYSVSDTPQSILCTGGGKSICAVAGFFFLHFPSNEHIHLKEWLTVNYGCSNMGIGEIFSQKWMKLASHFQENNCHNLLAMMELKLESIIKIQENLNRLLWARQHPGT